ncbi:MAG: TIGR00725 family protein [Methanobacteriota archaeon]
MKPLIAVCGSDGDDEFLSELALQSAERVGEGIAQQGGVLVCGGRGGVMKAACKGAKKGNGITVGILPVSKDEANEYVDIGIPTNLGNMRNFVVVSAADVIIAISGRWGTLNEITYAMILHKPVILLKGTGGCVDELASGKILAHLQPSFSCVSSADAAVKKAFEIWDTLKW